MLNNTLVTNEVKDNAGVEIEFERLDGQPGARSTVFAKKNESYNAPHRLSIKHDETGSGVNRVRRSLVRFDKTSTGQVDNTVTITNSAYLVQVIPVGNMTAQTEAAIVLANLLSFCATTGAASTVLFDGTGNGAQALLNGSL